MPAESNIHNTNNALGSQIGLNNFTVNVLVLQVLVEVLNQKPHVLSTTSGQVKSHNQHYKVLLVLICGSVLSFSC